MKTKHIQKIKVPAFYFVIFILVAFNSLFFFGRGLATQLYGGTPFYYAGYYYVPTYYYTTYRGYYTVFTRILNISSLKLSSYFNFGYFLNKNTALSNINEAKSTNNLTQQKIRELKGLPTALKDDMVLTLRAFDNQLNNLFSNISNTGDAELQEVTDDVENQQNLRAKERLLNQTTMLYGIYDKAVNVLQNGYLLSNDTLTFIEQHTQGSSSFVSGTGYFSPSAMTQVNQIASNIQNIKNSTLPSVEVGLNNAISNIGNISFGNTMTGIFAESEVKQSEERILDAYNVTLQGLRTSLQNTHSSLTQNVTNLYSIVNNSSLFVK